MNIAKLVIFSILLLGSGNLLAAKETKVLVCHVGEEGSIDLILVSGSSSHLGNAAHNFDGIVDYTPGSVGASGDGTEDFDGDGVDEGCEPPDVVACPCWVEDDLTTVTAENQLVDESCANISTLPFAAAIQNSPGSTPGVEGGFTAADFGSGPFCETRDFPVQFVISPEEFDACIELIVDRCADIGSPIAPAE
jgi:hypothetical protein